jgi:hypothetical protein
MGEGGRRPGEGFIFEGCAGYKDSAPDGVAAGAGAHVHSDLTGPAVRSRLGLFAAGSITTMKQDEEHLRLLSIFHYVVAGLAGLISLFPIIHLIIGLIFVFASHHVTSNGELPPAFIGWIFVILAATFITLGWIMAALILTTGRFLARRKHYQFCLVMAGIECLFMPFGTILGVFTILVLVRESVKPLFSVNPPNSAAKVLQ